MYFHLQSVTFVCRWQLFTAFLSTGWSRAEVIHSLARYSHYKSCLLCHCSLGVSYKSWPQLRPDFRTRISSHASRFRRVHTRAVRVEIEDDKCTREQCMFTVWMCTPRGKHAGYDPSPRADQQAWRVADIPDEPHTPTHQPIAHPQAFPSILPVERLALRDYLLSGCRTRCSVQESWPFPSYKTRSV